MEYTLHSGENEGYFPFGLGFNKNARAELYLDDLVARASSDPATRQVKFAQLLASTLNENVIRPSDGRRAARAGEVMALMLLHEIYRHLMAVYTRVHHPGIITMGLDHIRSALGAATSDGVMTGFVDYYPPREALERTLTPASYLAESRFGHPNTERTLLEMILVRIDHENPALVVYRPLFDDAPLNARVPLADFLDMLDRWFASQPPMPETGMTLLEMLREPFRRHPDSLEGQLEFIMNRWRALLPPDLVTRWLVIQGVIREEEMFRGLGPGPTHAYAFSPTDYAEPEAFTEDRDWMPNVVLMAKLAYVWLDQLSRQYGMRLSHLNDIPDAELDRLARWGINGLWLIGVWERSQASENIKHRMGNVEAAASAYSLYDYTIAQDLGGEAALQDLAYRAGKRGIRLAGDMVPNHMGIYSKWMVEHPERFLQLDYSPFPSYNFSGPDLSLDGRVGLFLEEGYWTHRDAAVVFKRVDNRTGESAYIYHGNDGTSMPWNDTAQLNFMLEDTREAVIQTIIQVARRFPIIRFDAAMTLAKKHYQRLWFPKPGDGGAIPSRAAFGMDRNAFDREFPVEFWREVVDRIAREAPNTLLLAEAFWLMEGYFVRTLGMHRVYNSAFMNMLKMEDNSKYRQTIKNVLEFSPEVLQRFVNFMNNPDEDTAEAQFGKGDKYFGVAVLLVTMPGLPMLGHGQVEGFTEKYGMEYRRAYKDEQPDQGFIERHEREVFPLMRKRYLFSNARNFALFDFVTPDGGVDENVFAYSNRAGSEHALILYNNAYSQTRGVLHTSTAINVGRGDEKMLVRRTLGESMGLDTDPRAYVVWCDERTKLEYLHHCETLTQKGLHLELNAYEYKTFVFVRQLSDTDGSWGRLHGMLGGAGVPSVQEAYLEMHLAPVLEPFREFMKPEMFREVLAFEPEAESLLGTWREPFAVFLEAMGAYLGREADIENIVCRVEADLAALQALIQGRAAATLPGPLAEYLEKNLPEAEMPETWTAFWRVPVACCLMRGVGLAALESSTGAEEMSVESRENVLSPACETEPPEARPEAEQRGARLMQEWLLGKHIAQAFVAMDGNGWQARQDVRLVEASLAHRAQLPELETEVWGPVVYALFENPLMDSILLANWHENRKWMNKEQLERVLLVLFLANTTFDGKDVGGEDRLFACYENLREILWTASDTGYDMHWTLNALK